MKCDFVKFVYQRFYFINSIGVSKLKDQIKSVAAGIHLSGPNSDRTCIVAVRKNAYNQYVISNIFEKIGSFGNLFADERIVDLIQHLSPSKALFTDAPLSAPPCVECLREACPGVVKCEDVGVAYILHLTDEIRDKKKPKKRKPLNPQSHRVWDAINIAQNEETQLEPTYSSNKAPLVVRGRTLQKRFNHQGEGFVLKETSVTKTLLALSKTLELEKDTAMQYRNFEEGRSIRLSILEKINDHRIVEIQEAEKIRIASSLQIFNAFICSLVACLYQNNRTTVPPRNFLKGDAWVYTPL